MVAAKVEARQILADVPQEYVFRTADGSVLRNLAELREALATMTQESYSHHVNSEKNDFANWVRDVVKDETLENRLRKAKKQAEAARLVAARISTLAKKAA